MSTSAAPPLPSPSTIAGDSAAVGAGAAASRILGFIRDVLIAALIGAGPTADALLVALRIPNLVRRIVAEGAVNGAFTPVHRRIQAEEGPVAAGRFAGESIAVTALGALVVLLIAEAVAPWIVLSVAGGFEGDPEKLAFAATLTRWTLPLIPASVLSAVFAALLAANGRLRWAALTPPVVNAVLVGALLGLAAAGTPSRDTALAIAAAISAAGLAQLALVAVPILKGHPRPIYKGPFLSGSLRKAAALAGPALATAASAQLSILGALYLASDLPASLAHLHYADRLFQLPLGFVAAGAGVVLLNEVIRLGRAGHTGAVGPLLDRALLLALLLALPAATGLALMAHPIASILFERGAFTSADTVAVASAITGLSLGLPAAATARVLAQPFLAAERSRPPMLGAVAALAATITAGLYLRSEHGVAGLGYAVSVGAWVDVAVLAVALRLAGWWRPGRMLLGKAALVVLASAGMGAAVLLARQGAAAWLEVGAPLWVRAAALAGLCAGGAFIYGFALLGCGARKWIKAAS